MWISESIDLCWNLQNPLCVVCMYLINVQHFAICWSSLVTSSMYCYIGVYSFIGIFVVASTSWEKQLTRYEGTLHNLANLEKAWAHSTKLMPSESSFKNDQLNWKCLRIKEQWNSLGIHKSSEMLFIEAPLHFWDEKCNRMPCQLSKQK